MSKRNTRWLPLSVAAALVALVAGLVAISGASASPATIALSSTTVTTGADATVTLSVTPTGAEEVGVVTVDIAFPAGLTAISCTNSAAGTAVCNTAFGGGTPAPTPGPQTGPGVVRYALAATSAVSGNVATLVFGTSAVGTYNLTMTIVSCADIAGTDLTCTATDGVITVQAPTPTPTPSPSPAPATPTPSPSPTRTPTPAALPPTGGVSSDGSGDGLAWVLGALGLAVLAGGVWAVSRTRRHTA